MPIVAATPSVGHLFIPICHTHLSTVQPHVLQRSSAAIVTNTIQSAPSTPRRAAATSPVIKRRHAYGSKLPMPLLHPDMS